MSFILLSPPLCTSAFFTSLATSATVFIPILLSNKKAAHPLRRAATNTHCYLQVHCYLQAFTSFSIPQIVCLGRLSDAQGKSACIYYCYRRTTLDIYVLRRTVYL